MHPQEHSGGEVLIPELNGCADTNPAGKAARLFHAPGAVIPQIGGGGGGDSGGAAVGIQAGPGGDGGFGFDQRIEKAFNVSNLAPDTEPANAPGIHQFVKLRFREVGDVLSQNGQCVGAGVGVIQFQPVDSFPLGDKAVFQRLREPVLLQMPVDETDGTLKVTHGFPAADIRRQTDMEMADGIIDVLHTASSFEMGLS